LSYTVSKLVRFFETQCRTRSTLTLAIQMCTPTLQSTDQSRIQKGKCTVSGCSFLNKE